MNRNWRMMMALCLAMALMVATRAMADDVAAAQPADDDDTPAQIKPYEPLVQKCKQYQTDLSGIRWNRVYDEQFKEDGDPGFVAQIPEVTVDDHGVTKQVPTTHFAKVEGKPVLVFDSTQIPKGLGEGLLAIGPKVNGDFAIEFEGQMISHYFSDLSIFCDGPKEGPGFQFGARNNTVNFIWTAATDAGGQPETQAVVAGNTPLIERNRWYHVRLEIMDGLVKGLVDGQVIGKAVLDPKLWDSKKDVQPYIYIWRSTARFRSIHVDQRVVDEKKMDPKEAWSKAFGEMKEADFRSKLNALAELMGDDDETVRDAAQQLMGQMGELAIPTLQTAVANGTPEESQRAGVLLKAFNLPTTDPSN